MTDELKEARERRRQRLASTEPGTSGSEAPAPIEGIQKHGGGFVEQISTHLSIANSGLRVGEFLLLMLLSGVAFGILGAIVFEAVPGVVILVALGVLMPAIAIRGAESRRLRSFTEQLPTALDLLVNGLRAGYSTLQAMEGVASELPDPISAEFQRVAQNMRLGTPMEEALDQMRGRIRSDDLGRVITAIDLQREVGGNLAEALDVLGGTLQDRKRISNEAQVLSRSSFLFVFGLAATIPIVQWVLFPGFFQLAFESALGTGVMMLAYGLISVAVLISAAISRRLTRIHTSLGQTQSLQARRKSRLDLILCAAALGISIAVGVPGPVVVWLTLLAVTRTNTGSMIASVVFGVLAAQAAVLSTEGFLGSVLSMEMQTTLAAHSPQLIRLGQGLLLVGILSLIGVAFLVAVYLHRSRSLVSLTEPVTAAKSDRSATSSSEIEMSASFYDRVIVPLSESLGRLAKWFSPRAVRARIHEDLEAAGSPLRLSPARFMALRGLAGATLGALIALAAPSEWQGKPYLIVAFGLLGFAIPSMCLAVLVNRRREGILRALPDALSYLTICMEGGLDLNAAMAQVQDKWDGELAMELGRVLQEIRLGKRRGDALRAMSRRLRVPELTTSIASIVQSEQLGVSMARVLRVQSDIVRARVRRSLEGRIHSLPNHEGIAFALLGPSLFLWTIAPIIDRVITLVKN